jgi:hypothetical protein
MSPHARRLRLQHWNIEHPRKLKAGYRDPGDGMFTELVFYLLTVFLSLHQYVVRGQSSVLSAILSALVRTFLSVRPKASNRHQSLSKTIWQFVQTNIVR